jgi:hypothetical protein
MNKPTLRCATAALGVATLLAAGCGGGDDATSTLSLSLTDAPVDDATTVWVQFTGVEVKPAAGEPEQFLFSAPKGFDLLTLQNGNAATLLGDSTVPAGDYEWVRLMLDPAPGSSYVIDDSGQHDIRIPSGAQTGLKLVRGFTMPAGGRADFTIDFLLEHSLIAPPGQSPDYLMKPVLRMTNNVETGTITGSFAPATLAAIPACTGVAPRVYLFTGTGVTPDDLYNPLEGPPDTAPDVSPLVTTTAALNNASEYTYTIAFVQTGSYTVAFTCDNDDPAVDENATTPLVFTVYAQPVTVTAGQSTTVNF